MKLADLQKALREVDPAAILVSPRVLERAIQQRYRLPTFLWNIPHRSCLVIDRHALFQYVEQDELDLEPDRLLPETVLLLARPGAEQLAAAGREQMLPRYWRLLFHARLHQALEQQSREGRLSEADVRERVEQIGRAEFEEVRMVLEEDHLLPPHADEPTVYVEFVAVFMELRFFAATELPVYFPGIIDPEVMARFLARDVDAAALFAQTRLPGAPDPVAPTDNSADEAHDYYWRLVRQADRARRGGDVVRAAILRTRAARVAPAALTASTRRDAEGELRRLIARLQAALHLTDAEAGEWLKDLPALLEKADQGQRPAEAALLYDLQKVCLDSEQEVYALEVVEWLLSAGNRPIKRPLPSQRLVRVVKHLNSAAQRLTTARLTDADRDHLGKLLQNALRGTEHRLRERFRPVLADALQDVGLRPANLPEKAAFHKLIEELLDRIIDFGFLTFSDLRDALSRNQLKLPDLADPQEFVRGDPLLRLDRRLATPLDGVYHRGEFYLRWLERATSLGFGTATGRLVTRFLLIPFGGALALTKGLQIILEKVHGPQLSPTVSFPLFLLLALFLLVLTTREAFRRGWARLFRRTGRFLHKAIIDVPSRILHVSLVRRFARSWPFQLFVLYLLKPLAACGVVWLCLPAAFETPARAAGVFVLALFLLNTRLGREVVDVLAQAVVKAYDLLRAGLVPGLFRLVVRLFKRTVDAVEYVLFTVDDWLRYRSGDSRLLMVARTILGVLWFPVSYVARFYMVVLIEPGINPIKFPISSLAAKFIYPFIVPLTEFLIGLLAPVSGRVLANVIAGTTVWLLPDAFGFLFWEMKENWGLFRANRSPTLRPAVFGPHGETVRRLLQPGFHSGTVPHLYARLREAEREGARTGNWRAVRVCRHGLAEVEKTLRRLVSREMMTLLRQSRSWQGEDLSVGRVALACNRLRVELIHAEAQAQPVWLEWELHAGWLVAGIRSPGWLDRLSLPQQQAVILALAGLYKRAGIDLVREQVSANLPAAVAGYDITRRGLLLYLDQSPDHPLLYELDDFRGRLRPPGRNGLAGNAPVLDASRLVFAQGPITWRQWVEWWQREQEGQPPDRLFGPEVRLLPVGPPVPESPRALPSADGITAAEVHAPEAGAVE